MSRTVDVVHTGEFTGYILKKLRKENKMSTIEQGHIDRADLPYYVETGEIAPGDALFRGLGLDPDPTADLDRQLRASSGSGSLALSTEVSPGKFIVLA